MFKNTSTGGKREGDEDACRRALHCIRAKLTNGSCFSCFSFLFKFVTQEKISESLLSWRWMCRCCCSSISPGFAESSWQGNREETCRSQITCNGQLQISHLIISFLYFYLPRVGVFLTTFSFFLSSSFVFILTFKRGTQPSCQFRLVSYIVSPTREGGVSRAAERAAPSVFRIMISFFLSFRQSTRNHKGKFTLRHCECIARHKG